MKLSSILTLVLLLGALTAFGQTPDTEKEEKKIVIIKKTVDEDGNEVVEKTVKEISGDEEDEMIFVNEDGETMEVEVEVETKGTGERHVIVEIESGDEEEEFEWTDDGTIPEEMRKRLEEKGIHIEESDGAHIVITTDKEGEYDMHTHQNKAFLGVMIKKEDESEVVMIGEVFPDSAAEEAGLLEGDVIDKVDGKPIRELSELLDALSGFEPGEQVWIEFTRDDMKKKVKAKLKEKPAKTGKKKVIILKEDNSQK